MNKPYQSIALELYTKLPYELDKNIIIKIIKEVKKKEINELFFKPYKVNKLYNIICNNKSNISNIFSHINKRSYYMYLLKTFFNKYKCYLKCRATAKAQLGFLFDDSS